MSGIVDGDVCSKNLCAIHLVVRTVDLRPNFRTGQCSVSENIILARVRAVVALISVCIRKVFSPIYPHHLFSPELSAGGTVPKGNVALEGLSKYISDSCFPGFIRLLCKYIQSWWAAWKYFLQTEQRVAGTSRWCNGTSEIIRSGRKEVRVRSGQKFCVVSIRFPSLKP